MVLTEHRFLMYMHAPFTQNPYNPSRSRFKVFCGKPEPL